jgi:outer membrane lipoprotein SlyB
LLSARAFPRLARRLQKIVGRNSWEPFMERVERERTHPILIAAGVAVLLFSLLGAAALTGVLPVGNTKPGEFGMPAQRTPVAAAEAPGAVPGAPACASCGVVESIRPVQVKSETSGVGAVAGGLAGGLVGNQFGHGGARTLLTIGGAAGGAFAGNAIEKNMKTHTVWRVGVRLEDGSLRTLSQGAQPPFSIGERVRIVNGTGIERA